MYRLLATDIDDTLLAPDGSLPPANHDVLNRLHASGVTIVFCSGRSDISIRGIAAPILTPADDEYYISFNGAKVVTADSRRIAARNFVSGAAVQRITAYTREHGLHVQGYLGDRFVIEQVDDFTHRYAAATQTEYEVVNDLAVALADGTPKLLIEGDHETLVQHQAELTRIGAELAGPIGGSRESDGVRDGSGVGFTAMFSKPRYLEVVAAGVNKGAALHELAALLGVPVKETLAIGDGDNDEEMLRAAGTGLAVANAHAKALAAATVVLESRAEDAAMVEVERRFFG